jgi:site-specific DNA-methyltransferase (adenine-specific)
MEAAARIICGDAAEVLRTLRSGTVALTVTSPPYFQHRDYGIAGQIGQEMTLTAYLERIGVVLSELLRITDEAGSCFFIVGDTYRNRKLLLVPHRIALLAGEIGWTIRNDIIWSKKDPAPESPRNRWRAGHEHALFLSKRPSGYRFNADAVRVPYSPATLRRWGAGQSYGGKKSQGRKHAKDSRMRDGQTFRLNPRGCLPADVWSLPSSNTSDGHYAAFPDQLIRPIIEACSNPGDLVLDPFAGSGTTCRVAISLGRRAVGIDLNPEYAAMASRRHRRRGQR